MQGHKQAAKTGTEVENQWGTTKKRMWPGKLTSGTVANGSKEGVGPTTLVTRVQRQVPGVAMGGGLHSWMPLHELISVLSWRGDLRGTNIRLSGRGHRSVTLVVSRGGGGE